MVIPYFFASVNKSENQEMTKNGPICSRAPDTKNASEN